MNLFPDKTEHMHVDDDVIAGGIAAPLTKFVSKLGGIVALQPSGARNVIIVYGRSASVLLNDCGASPEQAQLNSHSLVAKMMSKRQIGAENSNRIVRVLQSAKPDHESTLAMRPLVVKTKGVTEEKEAVLVFMPHGQYRCDAPPFALVWMAGHRNRLLGRAPDV